MLFPNIMLGDNDNNYVIDNKFYKKVESPTKATIKVAIIQSINIIPPDPDNSVKDELGRFHGPVKEIENNQTLRLKNEIEAGKHLDQYLSKIKKIIYLEPTSDKTFNVNHNNDLLICDKRAINNITKSDIYEEYDFVTFEMYDETGYVGKNVLETFPLMLLLTATYDEIVSYLKYTNLYQERWPFTHTWQNGCDFAQAFRSIDLGSFCIWTLGYFQSFNSLYIRDKFIPYLGPNDYVLIVDWGTVYQASATLVSKSKYPNNIYWLANGNYELESLKAQGINAKLVSHNVFINTQTFNILPINKKYDAIFCQTVMPFKRPYLASKINSIVYSTGSNPSVEYQQMINEQSGTLVTGSTPQQVATLMNQSLCGLSLSQAEGGNYATTEYLLCGLPVVTTQNLGGRDIYLNETNSIYVDDESPESVAKAVNYIKENRHKYDSNKIRNGALRKNLEMLITLKDEVLFPILIKNNVNPEGLENFLNQVLSSANTSSKGRTIFQPEYSMIRLESK